jgi:hypothetical protein
MCKISALWREQMIRVISKQLLSSALSCVLVLAAVPPNVRGQQPTPLQIRPDMGQGAPLSADELQQLVAPIALYR